MFPKHKSGPINGDVVSDADLQREKMKIDISALLGGTFTRCCANGANAPNRVFQKSGILARP
jgi:hypothetical protein